MEKNNEEKIYNVEDEKKNLCENWTLCMFICFKYKKEIKEHIFLYIIRENFLNIFIKIY